MNYYITHCDKNFLEHTEKLFETLQLHSNIKCIFFTIDFEYNSKYENVICVPFYSAQHINNKLVDTKAFAVFLKPLITKMVYTLPFVNKEDSFCYIDADCLCIENCDNVFNYKDQIIDYPLLNEGCHDFMIMNGRGDPYINNNIDLNLTLEAPLLKLLGYDINKRDKYLQTGVFLFNYNCLEFLNTWAQTCYDERVLRDWQYLTPFHEETVINCLLWQKDNLKCLNQVLVNIPYYSSEDDNLQKVNHLLAELVNPPNEDRFIYTFTKIPAKSKIKNLFFLHGKHSGIVYDFITSNMSNLYLKINSPSLGDTIASTPTLRKLSKTYNKKINVVTHVKEVFANNPYVNKIYSFDEFNNSNIKINNENIFETFLGVGSKNNLGVEKKHNIIDIRQFHAMDLGFMLLPNEMDYDFYPEPFSSIYQLPETYICLHVSETWKSRTYSKEKWQQLINLLNDKNIYVVLIGKNSYESGFHNIVKNVFDLNIKLGLDLTNKLNLSQTWHVINKSKIFVTMDSGPLHLAGTTDTFIIQLGSSINNLLRAPYRKGSQDYKYKYISGPCDIFCASDMKYGIKEWGSINGVPPLINCLENKKSFECHPDPTDVFNFINEYIFDNVVKEKYLFIAPHLSTGGSPKYLEWLIEAKKKSNCEIKVLEWNVYSYDYTVQRNNIIKIIGENNFKTVGGHWESEQFFIDKENEIIHFINSYNPDYIHLNEFSENFAIRGFTKNIIDFLYNKDRKFKLYETSHKAYIDFNKKINIPDELWLCSEYHYDKTKSLNYNIKKVEMHLSLKKRPDRNQILQSLNLDPNKLHVLQVGLFSVNKNQKFTFDLAKKFISQPVEFHFIGNTCYIDECGIDKNQINCKIWGERNDVDIFMSCMDIFVMPSHEELNPISIKEALSWSMPCYISKIETLYNKYKKDKLVNFIDNDNLINHIINQLKHFNLPVYKIEKNQIKISYNQNPRVDILGDTHCQYKIKFINADTNFCHYESFITNNMWSAVGIKYFVDWRIQIENLTDGIISEFNLNLQNKIVNIINESSSLGDTIAWMSSIDKFQKKHNCILNYFTAKKNLFEDNYKNINFYNYDDANKNNDSYIVYKIGCFNNDKDLLKKDWRTFNLQNIADEILGLPYNFDKPKIKINKDYKNNFSKYVCIATQSTSQSRYWNKQGWESVVNFLHDKGYKVICVDKDYSYGNEKFMNYCPDNVDLFAGNESFDNIINIINNCEFFIGLSSGLSWLSWALNKNIVLISGSVAEHFEFYTPYRVTNQKVCNGCFTDIRHQFNPSNWLWCPENKNFECSKEISFEMVKQKIDNCISKL